MPLRVLTYSGWEFHKRERGDNGAEGISEEIIAQSFQSKMKNMNPHINKLQVC